MLQKYKMFVLQTWRRRSPAELMKAFAEGRDDTAVWRSSAEDSTTKFPLSCCDGMELPNQCLPDFSLSSFPTLEVETDASADRLQGFCFQTPHAHSPSEVHS